MGFSCRSPIAATTSASARPDGRLAAGAPGGERQRRAPGAGADDREGASSRFHRPGGVWIRAASAAVPARRAGRANPRRNRSIPAQAIIGAVVGAERRRRRDEGEPGIVGERGEAGCAAGHWRRPAGGDEARAVAGIRRGTGRDRRRGAVDERVADRQLDRGGEVGEVSESAGSVARMRSRIAVLSRRRRNRQPSRPAERPRQRKTGGDCRAAPPLDRRAAGLRQTQQFWRSCRKASPAASSRSSRTAGNSPPGADEQAANARPDQQAEIRERTCR